MSTDWSKLPSPYDWGIVGSILVNRAVEGSIPDEIYGKFLDAMRSEGVKSIFALTSGSNSVTATQRKAAAEVMKNRNLLAVVMTENRLTRGILTAVSWLGGNVQAFQWSDLDDAITALSDSAAVQNELRNIAKDFHDRTRA